MMGLTGDWTKRQKSILVGWGSQNTMFRVGKTNFDSPYQRNKTNWFIASDKLQREITQGLMV